jgi:hypothetical protein
MQLDDPRLLLARLHDQDVYLPTSAGWDVLLTGEPLGQFEVPMREWIATWLRDFGRFEVARLALTLWRHGWRLVPLLHLSHEWYRVHFEDVICEHCGRRCGPSATPDTTQYAGTGLTTAQAWAMFDRLRVQACPNCSGLLRRRQTVWLALSGGGTG